MYSAIHINRLEHQVRIRLRGGVTYDDLQGLLTQLHSEDALCFRVLCDMQGASPHFTGADLAMLALRLRTLGSTSPVGNMAVVVGDRRMFELMLMQQSLLVGVCGFQPFWSAELAERWLEWKAESPPSLDLAGMLFGVRSPAVTTSSAGTGGTALPPVA